MPEILISDFKTVRVPSDFTLGDGSWNGDYDLSGSDLKVGVNGIATSHGGCSASFASLDLSSIIYSNSHGWLEFRITAGNLLRNLKVTLTDSLGGQIVWQVTPSSQHPAGRNATYILCHRPITGKVTSDVGYVTPAGLHYGGPEADSSTITDWTKINGLKIEGIGGPFPARSLEGAFTLFKAIKG